MQLGLRVIPFFNADEGGDFFVDSAVEFVPLKWCLCPIHLSIQAVFDVSLGVCQVYPDLNVVVLGGCPGHDDLLFGVLFVPMLQFAAGPGLNVSSLTHLVDNLNIYCEILREKSEVCLKKLTA